MPRARRPVTSEVGLMPLLLACPVDPAHGPMRVQHLTYCARCRGARGGRSVSEWKRAAARRNIRKAIRARTKGGPPGGG